MADGQKKIVIVDDDTDLRRLLSTSFKANGFEVVECADGREAKKYFLDEQNSNNTALLVLDRILPDMDGIDVLKEMKAKGQIPFPVLILSSLSSEKDVMQGLSLGAVDYIVKPFNMNIVIQKAKALLQR